jgi:hypothetical protein
VVRVRLAGRSHFFVPRGSMCSTETQAESILWNHVVESEFCTAEKVLGRAFVQANQDTKDIRMVIQRRRVHRDSFPSVA